MLIVLVSRPASPGGHLIILLGPLALPLAHGQHLEQIDKTKDGQIKRKVLMEVRYVALTD